MRGLFFMVLRLATANENGRSGMEFSLRAVLPPCRLRVCKEIIWTLWRERRAGRCEAPRRRRCRTSQRSGNKADARPPPRPSGLRPAGPLALLLAPHIPRRVLLVARA